MKPLPTTPWGHPQTLAWVEEAMGLFVEAGGPSFWKTRHPITPDDVQKNQDGKDAANAVIALLDLEVFKRLGSYQACSKKEWKSEHGKIRMEMFGMLLERGHADLALAWRDLAPQTGWRPDLKGQDLQNLLSTNARFPGSTLIPLWSKKEHEMFEMEADIRLKLWAQQKIKQGATPMQILPFFLRDHLLTQSDEFCVKSSDDQGMSVEQSLGIWSCPSYDFADQIKTLKILKYLYDKPVATWPALEERSRVCVFRSPCGAWVLLRPKSTTSRHEGHLVVCAEKPQDLLRDIIHTTGFQKQEAWAPIEQIFVKENALQIQRNIEAQRHRKLQEALGLQMRREQKMNEQFKQKFK